MFHSKIIYNEDTIFIYYSFNLSKGGIFVNQKKGARLALKLSLTVVIPIFLITIAGILLSAYKQSDLSEDLVKREVSGIARSLRQTYLATEGNEKSE